MSKRNTLNVKLRESKLNEILGRRNAKRLKRSTTNQRGNSRRYAPFHTLSILWRWLTSSSLIFYRSFNKWNPFKPNGIRLSLYFTFFAIFTLSQIYSSSTPPLLPSLPVLVSLQFFLWHFTFLSLSLFLSSVPSSVTSRKLLIRSLLLYSTFLSREFETGAGRKVLIPAAKAGGMSLPLSWL